MAINHIAAHHRPYVFGRAAADDVAGLQLNGGGQAARSPLRPDGPAGRPKVLYQDTANVYRELLTSGKAALVEWFLDRGGLQAMGAVQPASWHRKDEAFCLRNLGAAAGGQASR